MPYYVQKIGQSWQLSWRTTNERRAVPKGSPEAASQGFRPEMTLDEARRHAKRLQTEASIKLQQRRAARGAAIVAGYKKLRSAFLTDADATEFEQRYLKDHKIKVAHWNTMQKIIVGVALHPEEWFEQKKKLYAQFSELKCSPNYAKKLLRYLNLWGYFICKKQKRAWMKVPGMDGTWVNELERKRRSKGASKPLAPEALAAKKSEIQADHYRWLHASVWFGLRPREVDNLGTSNEELWYVSNDGQFDVLSVFQEKLYERGVRKEDCWKHLPAVFPEQEQIIQWLRECLSFVRPKGAGGRFMRNTFGPGFSHYAGRNNFSGMLRDRGFDLETRKHWLGHLSIKTTEQYDRKTMKGKAFYREPIKKAG